MRLNKKAEVFTLTVLIAVGIAMFLLGTTNNPIKTIFGLGNAGQKTKQSVITKTESYPVFVKDVNTGKLYVLQTTKSETSTLNTNEEPKMTIWQKLLALPRLWLILMILGIFFPPVAAIMGVINKTLWNKAKQIVGGVEESLKNLETTQPDAKQKVLDTLSKKYDSSTKLFVSKIKSKL